MAVLRSIVTRNRIIERDLIVSIYQNWKMLAFPGRLNARPRKAKRSERKSAHLPQAKIKDYEKKGLPLS